MIHIPNPSPVTSHRFSPLSTFFSDVAVGSTLRLSYTTLSGGLPCTPSGIPYLLQPSRPLVSLLRMAVVRSVGISTLATSALPSHLGSTLREPLQCTP